MTPEDEMRDAIRDSFRTLRQSATSNLHRLNKGYVYTGYIAALIIDALAKEPGISITVMNPSGRQFLYPMGPSKIFSSPASYYKIRTTTNVLEMHLCCKCDGVSGHEHELDILMLREQNAADCRLGRNPRISEVILLIECKNVGAIEYGVGREFIGLCFEFPIESDDSNWAWRGTKRLGVFVGTLAGVPNTPSAFRLVADKKLIAQSHVEPSQPSNIQAFQREVIGALRPYL